jgi:dsDNA-specific endonuclease/ATPase MutS2
LLEVCSQYSPSSQVYHRVVLSGPSAMNSDNPFPEPVPLPIEDVLDLHTVSPRDVRAVVEEYLVEANRLGFKALRIIHGRGIGVQRELVRSLLAETPFVLSYAEAPAEAGGWGATIVTLI